MPKIGFKQAKEHIEKRTKSLIGKKRSDEVCKKISIAKMGSIPSDKSRALASKRMIEYNKSESHRLSVIVRNKSEKGRLASSGKHNMSVEGRRVCSNNGRTNGLKNLLEYNTSEKFREKHKEVSSKVLATIKPRKIIKSQKILNDALCLMGFKTKVEYQVPEVHRFIDIAIPDFKLAVEVDGESHSDRKFLALFGGSLEDRIEDDKLKDQQLHFLGWKVLRITNKEIFKNLENVIEKVRSGIET